MTNNDSKLDNDESRRNTLSKKDAETLSQHSSVLTFNTVSSISSAKSRKVSPGRVSDHLLQPTASVIHAQQKLLEMRENPRDDIWGTLANASKYEQSIQHSREKFGYLESKLLEPTVAYEMMKYEKTIREEIKIPKAINPESRILVPTEAFLNSYPRDDDTSSKVSSNYTGSLSNESRLLEPTYSSWHKTSKAKSILEADQARLEEEFLMTKASEPKLSKTPDRLLQPTVSSIHQKHPKLLPIPEDTESSPVITKKVKETPASVMAPNAAYENRKWKGSPRSVNDWTLKENSGPIPEHLLSPTAAFESSRYKKSEQEKDVRETGWKSFFMKSGKIVIPGPDGQEVPLRPTSTVKVKEVSDRLLIPTLANEAYKNSWNRTTPQTTSVQYSSRSKGRQTGDFDSRSLPAGNHIKGVNEDDFTLDLSVLTLRRKGSFASTISTTTEVSEWNASKLDDLVALSVKAEARGMLEETEAPHNPDEEEITKSLSNLNSNDICEDSTLLTSPNESFDNGNQIDSTISIDALAADERKEDIQIENSITKPIPNITYVPIVVSSNQPVENKENNSFRSVFEKFSKLAQEADRKNSVGSNGSGKYASSPGSQLKVKSTSLDSSTNPSSSGFQSSTYMNAESSSDKIPSTQKSNIFKRGRASPIRKESKSNQRSADSSNAPWSVTVSLRPVRKDVKANREITTNSDPPVPSKFLVKDTRGSVKDLVKVFSRESSPRS